VKVQNQAILLVPAAFQTLHFFYGSIKKTCCVLNRCSRKVILEAQRFFFSFAVKRHVVTPFSYSVHKIAAFDQ
jgi:hypothetical protein